MLLKVRGSDQDSAIERKTRKEVRSEQDGGHGGRQVPSLIDMCDQVAFQPCFFFHCISQMSHYTISAYHPSNTFEQTSVPIHSFDLWILPYVSTTDNSYLSTKRATHSLRQAARRTPPPSAKVFEHSAKGNICLSLRRSIFSRSILHCLAR